MGTLPSRALQTTQLLRPDGWGRKVCCPYSAVAGYMCEWFGRRVHRTWGPIWFWEKRPLASGENCASPKDRRTQAFEEFPFLSLSSTQGEVRVQRITSCVLIAWFLSLSPSVCSHCSSLRTCCHHFSCLKMCLCHHPARETKSSFIVGGVCNPSRQLLIT